VLRPGRSAARHRADWPLAGIRGSARVDSMFLRHSVHIEQSADRCREQLLERPRRWLPGSVHLMSHEGPFEAPAGISGPTTSISERVGLTVGPVIVADDWLTIPLAWRATGPDQLFPILIGELKLEPVDPGASRLTLSGTYRPPFGSTGREIDAAVMHHVAEATIRNFAEGVAARVSELASSGVSDPN